MFLRRVVVPDYQNTRRTPMNSKNGDSLFFRNVVSTYQSPWCHIEETLKMETAKSFKKLVPKYQTMPYFHPEDTRNMFFRNVVPTY